MSYLDKLVQQTLRAEVFRALTRIIGVMTNSTQPRIAIVGAVSELRSIIEVVRDDGLVECATTFYTDDPSGYRAGGVNDANNPRVDVIVTVESEQYPNLTQKFQESTNKPVIDWNTGASVILSVLNELGDDVPTCLNPRKLLTLCWATVLSPRGTGIECGVYMGGTTVVLSRLLAAMGNPSNIFALDTFEGLPEPTQPDQAGPMVFKAGQFADTNLNRVKNTYSRYGVAGRVHPIAGLVQDTMPTVMQHSQQFAFAFLDMDQYAGTAAALQLLKDALVPGAFIVVDDTRLSGVAQAIDEYMKINPNVRRGPLAFSFTGLYHPPN